MQEKISIVMTSYNYARYIREAIESVISQTYTNWELIIVDDGSTDNSVEIINEYTKRDSRIKLFQHSNCENRGLAESVKLGIDNSESKWIAFLESDDKFLPNALKDKMDTIDSYADIDFIFSGVRIIGCEERIQYLQQFYIQERDKHVKLDSSKYIPELPDILPKLNIIPTFSVVMVKKDLIQNCNFNSICKPSLDYFLWAQLSTKKIYYLNKVSTEWRMHKNSYITTDTSSWFKKFLFYTSTFYQTVKNKNVFICLLLTLNFMRQRFIYVKFNQNLIQLTLFNGKYIFEKRLK